MWYIFNSDGKAIASCDFEPNNEDLAIRGESAIESPEKIPLNKVAINEIGKVVARTETSEEMQERKILELNAIYEPLFNSNAIAYSVASMDGNEQTMQELKIERASLKAEYYAKMDAILMS